VSGGEQTLRELVHEFKTKGPVYRRTVATTLKASYTNHYRRGLIKLLEVLAFRSSNTAHQPVIEALVLIGRYAEAGSITYYPVGETVPVHRGLGGDWQDVVYRADKRGQPRVVRMVYEVATFQALRDQLRCKEIWVVGADRWRNPDEDLPADFAERREQNYRELRKPVDPAVFVEELREQMRTELAALNAELPQLGWVQITERRSGAIKLTPVPAQPEPRNLRRVKAEVLRRWGSVPLVDMLKEAVLRTGCLGTVTSVATGGSIRADVLAERLLLAIYAYGTNTGIKAVAAGGHGHSEDDIRYVRRRYLTVEAARAIAVGIANATFAARSTELWGTGSTAVASDSTHVRAFDQNIFTEWHSGYGGRGVLIYWHVEHRSMAVHSQLISCTASEVAAMVEGAIRHGTTMDVESNYVDSHGQSEIGFGVTRLLGFDLLPRIKRINTVKLYRPSPGAPDTYPNLAPALTRPIRFDLIAEQYDQMIKYATAIRAGTASTEAIPAPLHPQRLPPHLRGDARGRACPEDHLLRALPAHPGPAAGDRGRAQRDGVLQRRELRDRLRQGRGDRQQPPRRAGEVRAVPADPADRPGLREHSDAPRRSGRTRVGGHPHPGGPARVDAVVLDARPALRGGPPRHELPPAPRPHHMTLSALEQP